MSTRQIAARLRVSQPTIVRDLQARGHAEAEGVLAALAGEQPTKPILPQRLSQEAREQFRQVRWKRRRKMVILSHLDDDPHRQRRVTAQRLRAGGMSMREIARQIGVSPATVLRDLRRGT